MNIQPQTTITPLAKAGLAAGAITATGTLAIVGYATNSIIFAVPLLPALGTGALLITLGFILGRLPAMIQRANTPDDSRVIHITAVRPQDDGNVIQLHRVKEINR
jgi:hypothetical protein